MGHSFVVLATPCKHVYNSKVVSACLPMAMAISSR